MSLLLCGGSGGKSATRYRVAVVRARGQGAVNFPPWVGNTQVAHIPRLYARLVYCVLVGYKR